MPGTRLRSIKNELISIPNSAVIGSHITNFSSEAAGVGLIVHTTVTIGHNVPWRWVHELLLQAAAGTDGLERAPAPFVLQTSLDAIYVSYQLNAYTTRPNEQATIYSRLHQEIQDAFNAGGVEIMSPHYLPARDGNETTILAVDRPENYLVPRFRVAHAPIPRAGPPT